MNEFVSDALFGGGDTPEDKAELKSGFHAAARSLS